MRILAIDTALEACSASVFDSDDGAIASQTLPMARGQAEALIPLVRDVVEHSDVLVVALADKRVLGELRERVREDQLVIDLVRVPQPESWPCEVRGLCW